jgi:hypothetical protein
MEQYLAEQLLIFAVLTKRVNSHYKLLGSVDYFYGVIAFYVEQPHYKGSALYKYPTSRCKNNLKGQQTLV